MGPCSQPYLRDDLVTDQLTEKLESIAISKLWADILLEELEKERAGEMINTRSYLKNLESEIKVVSEKMNKLVGIYLAGEIEQEIYIKRKNELMMEKANLGIKRADLGGKRNNWFEPSKEWVKTAENVGVQLACKPEEKVLRDLLEKVGSNRLMRGKKIEFDFVKPYDFISKFKALQGGKEKSPRVEQGLENEKKDLRLWLRKGWDSNPRYLSVNTLSKRARSATLPPFLEGGKCRVF